MISEERVLKFSRYHPYTNILFGKANTKIFHEATTQKRQFLVILRYRFTFFGKKFKSKTLVISPFPIPKRIRKENANFFHFWVRRIKFQKVPLTKLVGTENFAQNIMILSLDFPSKNKTFKSIKGSPLQEYFQPYGWRRLGSFSACFQKQSWKLT